MTEKAQKVRKAPLKKNEIWGGQYAASSKAKPKTQKARKPKKPTDNALAVLVGMSNNLDGVKYYGEDGKRSKGGEKKRDGKNKEQGITYYSEVE